MTFLILRLIQFAHALQLASAPATPPEAALKCGPQPPRSDRVVALDGAFITVDPDSILRDLKTEDILSIQIVCMDPQDSTFNRTHGIPVMLVRTKEGPASYVKRQLAAILAAQDAHFRRESTYISDLSRIALPFRAAQLRVSIDVRAKGWLAKATVEQSSLVCFVFSGDIRPPHPRLLPGRPDCNEDREALP